MQSEWDDFVADALDWMRDAPIRDEAGGFSDEEALTLYLATGLREVFRGHFGLTSRSVSLCDHVVFRNGPTPEDQRAWTACIENKRIPVHGIDYVPDILIRLAPGQQRPVLPLEVKLIKNKKKAARGPEFARALGQGLIYAAYYERAVVFVGVQTEDCIKKPFVVAPGALGEKLANRMEAEGVTVIVRDVSQAS